MVSLSYIFFGLILAVVHGTTNAATFSKAFTLSSAVKQYVTDLHNNFRSQVARGNLTGQPAAANMQILVWDDKIAQWAQDTANTCSFNHRPNTNRTLTGYGTTGENIAMGGIFEEMTTDEDLKANFLQSVGPTNNEDSMWWGWADEYRDYIYSTKTCSGVCGHYTQVAWAKSSKVGCAIAQCSGVEDMFWTELGYFVVCNYISAMKAMKIQ